MGIVPDSQLDYERHSLVLEGQEFSLTPLECHQAAYWESRRGKTATRDDRLTEVWGNAAGSGSRNVVDAVVKSLGRELGPHAQHIETIRGFGYRWCDE